MPEPVGPHQSQDGRPLDLQLVHSQGRGPAVALDQVAQTEEIPHGSDLCLSQARTRFKAPAQSMRTTPRAMPMANSPLPVSRAMAVVMVLVCHLNVTPDHHRDAHLGDHPAVGGQGRGQDGEPGLPEG